MGTDYFLEGLFHPKKAFNEIIPSPPSFCLQTSVWRANVFDVQFHCCLFILHFCKLQFATDGILANALEFHFICVKGLQAFWNSLFIIQSILNVQYKSFFPFWSGVVTLVVIVLTSSCNLWWKLKQENYVIGSTVSCTRPLALAFCSLVLS